MLPPFSESLCRQCAHLREVTAARSRFLLCTEGRPPKYPPQPVRECPFFRRAQGGEAERGEKP